MKWHYKASCVQKNSSRVECIICSYQAIPRMTSAKRYHPRPMQTKADTMYEGKKVNEWWNIHTFNFAVSMSVFIWGLEMYPSCTCIWKMCTELMRFLFHWIVTWFYFCITEKKCFYPNHIVYWLANWKDTSNMFSKT